MVHRTVPSQGAYYGYTGGGCRSIVPEVNDKTLMQEANNATGMKGESWPNFEAPQNYGFSSVCADADKGKDGAMMGAEAFISFMGSNRSFPVAGVMDDRRHRLKGLGKGSSAMFGLKDWGQQFLIHEDGMTMSGNTGRKIRLQLVANKNQKQQQQAPTGAQATQQAADGGGSGGGGTEGQQQQDANGLPKPTGQETLHGESSSAYYDITAKATEQVNKEHVIMLDDKETAVHLIGGEVYLGGKKGQGKFSRVITEDGVSKNVWARIA